MTTNSKPAGILPIPLEPHDEATHGPVYADYPDVSGPSYKVRVKSYPVYALLNSTQRAIVDVVAGTEDRLIYVQDVLKSTAKSLIALDSAFDTEEHPSEWVKSDLTAELIAKRTRLNIAEVQVAIEQLDRAGCLSTVHGITIGFRLNRVEGSEWEHLHPSALLEAGMVAEAYASLREGHPDADLDDLAHCAGIDREGLDALKSWEKRNKE